MPTPVAALLKSPEITFNRVRWAVNGSRLLLNCMSAPEPFAPQCGGLMPLPMNSDANRFGAADAPEADSPARNGIDSSQGRAIVTPTPLSKVRRLIFVECAFIVSIPRQVLVDGG